MPKWDVRYYLDKTGQVTMKEIPTLSINLAKYVIDAVGVAGAQCWGGDQSTLAYIPPGRKVCRTMH